MNVNVLIEAAKVIGALATVGGVLAAVWVFFRKLTAGVCCQLRSEMLQIYYRYEELEQIPQYQYENFVQMYDAYKALHGNSFIDKIYRDLQNWEIVKRVTGKHDR